MTNEFFSQIVGIGFGLAVSYVLIRSLGAIAEETKARIGHLVKVIRRNF